MARPRGTLLLFPGAGATRDQSTLVRIEQLYPLSESSLVDELARYKPNCQVFWVQEEPRNMGAWYYINSRFGPSIGGRYVFSSVCRPESASPATGSHASHKQEQRDLIKEAFGC